MREKGLVESHRRPQLRRYMYYLTPQGFAEKSRLTVEYLSSRFDFFRRAKAECGVLFNAARERGLPRVALAGISDVAEIAMICALDTGVTVVAIVDERAASTKFIGVPVASSFEAIANCDAVVITDLHRAAELSEQASTLFGRDRVFTPNLILPPRRAAQREADMTVVTKSLPVDWHVVQVHLDMPKPRRRSTSPDRASKHICHFI